MAINPEALRKHYASLSDEALLLIESDDLTAMAQKIFEAEIRRRGLTPGDVVVRESNETDSPFRNAMPNEDNDPDWLEHGFPATVYNDIADGAALAAEARAALLAAGIPCEITEHQVDPADEPPAWPHREFRVMVPGAHSLQATSVLDTAVYNPKLEEEWKTQLASLTDDELKALRIEAVCEGLLDRVRRLQKAYKSEVARRLTE